MRAILALLGACTFHANASSSAGAPDAAITIDGSLTASDAGGDAPTIARTLHQTNDDAIASGASAACASGSHTLAETWYRAFALGDYGIVAPFQVSGVDVAVQSANASSPITVSIGTYAGTIGGTTIDLSRATWIASAQAMPPTGGAAVLSVPIPAAIPAGGAFVVAIAAPDMGGSSSFVIGSTTSGEARPGYFASPPCGASLPETTGAAGAIGQIVIDVRGT